MTKPNIAILGATGVVGREITKIAEELGISQAQVSRLEKSALKIIFDK